MSPYHFHQNVESVTLKILTGITVFLYVGQRILLLVHLRMN